MNNFFLCLFFRHFLLTATERLQPVQHEVQPVRTTDAASTASATASAASTAATVSAIPVVDAAFHPVRAADGRSTGRIPQRELPEPSIGELSGGDAESAVWSDVTAAAVPFVRATTATTAATTTAAATTKTSAAFQPIPGEPRVHRTHLDKLSNVRFSVDFDVAVAAAGDDGAVHQLDDRAANFVASRPSLRPRGA